MIHSKSALILALAGTSSRGASALTNTTHCFENFEDDTAVCQKPEDIDPLGIDGQDCTKLPDCPYWCDPDIDYCNTTTTLIKGEDVPKYQTEFFVPPVLVNRRFAPQTVAVREFHQPILPENDYPKTRIWGYGDPGFWNGTEEPISFHNPAASMEVWQNSPLNIAFLNDLVKDPEACRCHPTPSNCEPLKHVLQDCQGVPVVDTKLHWANPGGVSGGKANCTDIDKNGGTDCTGEYSYVYDGPVPNVVHVHGAHADPQSDGYTEAWFLPKLDEASQDTYASGGSFFDTFDQFDNPTQVCPEGRDAGVEVNQYRNDQATSTLFYHDHTLGMTRLNVMAISAGFYFIRDPTCVSNNQAGLKWYGESGMSCATNTLPGPPPTAELYNNKNWYVKPPYADAIVRELPIAIQDMSFFLDEELNETRQHYPADHDNFLDEEDDLEADPVRWGCNNLNGNEAYQNDERENAPGHTVPPIWNPEVFFDVAVVNGRAWPVHQVSSSRYRLRLLNACDSRTVSLSAWWVPNGTPVVSFEDLFTNGTEIPIWVLGTEQSLLPDGPAKILSTDGQGGPGSVEKFNCSQSASIQETLAHQGLLMQPGERYDALIDFTELDNTTEVYLINTGPNEPFKTFELVDQTANQTGNANRASFDTLGQIMKFYVNASLDDEDVSTDPEELCFDKNAGGVAMFTEDEVDANRTVYLKEEVTANDGALGPYAAVLDNVFDDPEEGKGWSKPITENIPVDTIEEWYVVNLSADSHPVHLHQVKFQVVSRCASNDTDCYDGKDVLGYETGWKDAVIAPPFVDEGGEPILDENDLPVGKVTTIRMKFDILGVYVWHCHILSHEDNEMMRPMCVYNPDELSTLNMCCPNGYVYNETSWDEGELLCEPSPCADRSKMSCSRDDGCEWNDSFCRVAPPAVVVPCSEKNKKQCKRDDTCEWTGVECINDPDPNAQMSLEDTEDPIKMKSSSTRVGFKVSSLMVGALVGTFLGLWL